MSKDSRVVYKGKYVSAIDREILEALDTIMGYKGDLTLTQGGFNRGGVAASGGTHDGGGAFDLTFNDAKKKVKVLRLLGCAAWRRFRPTFDSDHVHAIVLNNDSTSAGANNQKYQYNVTKTDGLALYGKDQDWRPAVEIRFVFGASKRRWVAIRNTGGYSQPKRSVGYLRRRVSAGTAWKSKNVATVSSDGLWLVSNDLKFYPKGDFMPLWTERRVNNVKYVSKSVSNVRRIPNPGAKVTGKTKKGQIVVIVAEAKIGDLTWIKTKYGNWLPKRNFTLA